MTFKFSKRSQANLDTCHPHLQRLMYVLINFVDFTVIEGVRTVEKQREYVEKGVSKTMNSMHLPDKDGWSRAVDLAPFPIDWNDTGRFYMFVGFVRGIAIMHSIPIRCGADWNMNFQIKDQTFHDLPHYELVLDD